MDGRHGEADAEHADPERLRQHRQAIRQRGMPSARSTAYSRMRRHRAAYSVWLVTTAPTSRPRRRRSPGRCRPCLDQPVHARVQRELGLVKADMSSSSATYSAFSRRTTAWRRRGLWHLARTYIVIGRAVMLQQGRAVFSEQKTYGPARLLMPFVRPTTRTLRPLIFAWPSVFAELGASRCRAGPAPTRSTTMVPASVSLSRSSASACPRRRERRRQGASR